MRISDWSSDVCSSDLFLGKARLAASVDPVDDLHVAIGMFDKGGATLHPIAVIVIGDVAELPDFGGMNVPADDPIHVTLGGGVRDRLFKAADIFDRILHQTGRASCRDRVCQYV